MHANQTDIQKILGNAQQYVIPHFQRPYSWETKQWQMLWADLNELCGDEKPKNHFIGSIVTMPSRSVPEGVNKYVLIDGQQRLTTLLVFLAAIRDVARQRGEVKLAEKIDDLILKNRHQEGNDIFKVLPTQSDRPEFFAAMNGGAVPGDGGIARAYGFFGKKLHASPHALDKLYTVACKNLVLVSIVLDREDNPYLIFESLNAKGQPLSQGDLIRNFFFMMIDPTHQDRVYQENWRPMQERLKQHMTEFIRHFLMRDGQVVRKTDIYFTLKDRVEAGPDEDIARYLGRLSDSSVYYARLLDPSLEPDARLSRRLARINRFEATTAYPLLLNLYHDHAAGTLGTDEFAAVLDVLETFLIRRFVCGVPTHTLNKIFSPLYAQAKPHSSLLGGVRHLLADKNFPRDEQFHQDFVKLSIYSGDRREKARLILDRLEQAFAHKETIDPGQLTIEHVMPQTLTAWWKERLGEDWVETHGRWLNTIGNLTLTGYNPELSNSDYPSKRAILARSHIELNRHFAQVEEWDEEAIARRREMLAELALKVWPDFAGRTTPEGDSDKERRCCVMPSAAFPPPRCRVSSGSG